MVNTVHEVSKKIRVWVRGWISDGLLCVYTVTFFDTRRAPVEILRRGLFRGVTYFVGWFDGLLVGCLIDWLVGWLAGWLGS